MEEIWTAIERSYLVGVLRASSVVYPLVSGLHVLGIGLLVGSAIAMDLRLAGLWRTANWRSAVPMLAPLASAGLALAVTTGALLFSVRASVYAGNPAMLTKWSLIVIGVVNALVLHLALRRLTLETNAAPAGIRVGAVVSAAVWIAAVFAGRWIAFVGEG